LEELVAQGAGHRYGNSLRGDDNIGCHVAQMLDCHYHDDPDVRVIDSYQLTPEMAEDVAASEFVLFLDAATGQTAGKIDGDGNTSARAGKLLPITLIPHFCCPLRWSCTAAHLGRNY